MSAIVRLLLLTAALAACATACRREAPAVAPAPAGASRPVDAVLLPARHLRDGDLAGFARDAVPPGLYQRLQDAWARGSRWPLEELPLHGQLPALLQTLAAEDSETRLRRQFREQFGGAEAELRQAVEALGLFGVHYVQGDAALDEHARERDVQLITALVRWGLEAPLADPARADAAIARLAAAARATGLRDDDAFAAAGMEGTLRRLSPFLAEVKQVVADYGLDIDAALSGIDATLERQTGDRAVVRLRYELAGQPIDGRVAVERRGGRWYRSDYLRRAEASAAAGQPAAPAPPGRPGEGA
ncbi:hypothetical protein QFW77_03410 [Luteimonas sp. RD2P54]|uniref:Uncharacterized protein n=1 Tax=Luteimonas endophytica TaxID=3042023 RepID=A0ABT6J5D4_9GAMM|nr:hypothetical protein [Luteimonas endophytica]MDH5822042.1 hypothetical protein [Luteimonas endophytica]